MGFVCCLGRKSGSTLHVNSASPFKTLFFVLPDRRTIVLQKKTKRSRSSHLEARLVSMSCGPGSTCCSGKKSGVLDPSVYAPGGRYPEPPPLIDNSKWATPAVGRPQFDTRVRPPPTSATPPFTYAGANLAAVDFPIGGKIKLRSCLTRVLPFNSLTATPFRHQASALAMLSWPVTAPFKSGPC